MIGNPSNVDAAPAEVLSQGLRVICDHCPNGFLRSSVISTAFWQDEGLVVVRNIPAMVCPDCGEQYVDDLTVVRLDHLRGKHFVGLPAIEQAIVPILDFGGTG